MKNAYLILLTFVLSLTALAQPVGNIWHYAYANLTSTGYLKMEYYNDTVVGSTTYMNMSKTLYVYQYPGIFDTIDLPHDYLRWNADSVFRLVNGQEHLMFAFTMQPGDTLYPFIKTPLGGCDSVGKAIIDSIGIITIESNVVRWISISPVAGSVVGTYGKIIEGIGPVEDYFFPEYIGCIMDANEGGPLRCHSIDEYTYYQAPGTQPCEYIIAIEELNSLVSIYPNPASDYITFSIPSDKESQVHVFNAEGQVVTECQSTEPETSVYIGHLRPGLYFVEICGRNPLHTSFIKK